MYTQLFWQYHAIFCNMRVIYVDSAFNASWVGKLSTGLWLGLRWSVFTCVGWQVTLCDSTSVALKLSFIKSSTLLNLTYTANNNYY